jgi:hypothetical protein
MLADSTDNNHVLQWKTSIKRDLGPNSQFVFGNSNGLRLGVEFNLSSTTPNNPNYYDSKLGIGVTNTGVGIKYTAKF